MFGNPLVGNPIAALAMSTLAMTRRLGCGFCMFWPTDWTKGSTISAATVWLIKVATTKIKAQNTSTTLYKLMSCTDWVMEWAMVCSNPDELTDFPRDKPPAARMMMVHRKLLKSSFVRMPVPKNRTSGMMAMTPISPNTGSRR